MIYQILLYNGAWDRKISKTLVRSLLQKRVYCPVSSPKRWYAKPDQIEFQSVEEDNVLLSVEVIFHLTDDRDCELIRDQFYDRLYELGPEYESMVEVTLTQEA